MKAQIPAVSILVLTCLMASTASADRGDTQAPRIQVAHDSPLLLALQTRRSGSPSESDSTSADKVFAQPLPVFVTINFNTPVIDLPEGAFFEDMHFSARQLRALRGAGISTARDLIEAEPVALGRLLGIEPRQTSMYQHNLRENAEKNPKRSKKDSRYPEHAIFETP